MELTTLQNIKELGSTVIVAFFGFKTIGDIVKQWIKSKNGKNVTNLKLDDEFEESFKLLLGQVELMNSNHLNSIEKAIRQSSEKTVKAITDGNMKMVELLSRIEGKIGK